MMEEILKPDVVIVGTGAAGLFAALNLTESLNILMITKDKTKRSDSYLAQGGISALRSPDDYDAYFEDTMKAGHYENDKKSVDVMISESTQIIEDLMECRVDFDRKGEELSRTREGAHSTFRILHHKDETGKEITSKLLERVKERTNVTLLEDTIMIDIISKDNLCCGIIIEDQDKKLKKVYAKIVIMATGGVGGLFDSSTNYGHITGDGLAIALRNKIEVENMNYIQIHPTTLFSRKKKGRRFLISESVRGEGAMLLNKEKERFVDELLPRDLVSAAIREQMSKDSTPYVYLRMSHLEPKIVKGRFPNIYQKCLEEGYDLTKDDIPVIPAQHYLMGGIKVNIDSLSSMEHLFAVGEVSCNGVHGANRLASNSLLESLVFAKRASACINNMIENLDYQEVDEIDWDMYKDIEQYKDDNKKLILSEIKRRDEAFYDKWCNNEDQCG